MTGFAGGGLLAAGLLALWTVAHGTSLSGVWFAMYQFRLEATRLMAAHPSAAAAARGQTLILDALSSGMVVVAGLFAVVVSRRRHDHPPTDPALCVAGAAPLALTATLGYDVLSIYLGSGFWGHYLVQLAVPLALAAGLAVGSRVRGGRLVLGLVVSSAVVAVIAVGLQPRSVGGSRLGEAIGAVARPTDTIVTVWGHADVTRSSGLASPYPYLWSLPERTLDPRLNLLDATLKGPEAPVWFVSWSGIELNGIDTSALGSILARYYHSVAHLGASVVYLRNGVDRAAPVLTTASRP